MLSTEETGALRVAELRRELRARGLSALGDKRELAERLERELIRPTMAEEASESPLASAAPANTKKIVLNRTASSGVVCASEPVASAAPDEESPPPAAQKPSRPVADSKTRLEMRARRFGLPMTGDAVKEARKARFGQGSESKSSPVVAPVVSASLEVLKKRAERFGSSVSPLMVDAENREKLERRKAKFNVVESS